MFSRIKDWVCRRLNVVTYGEFDAFTDNLLGSLHAFEEALQKQRGMNELIVKAFGLKNPPKKPGHDDMSFQ